MVPELSVTQPVLLYHYKVLLKRGGTGLWVPIAENFLKMYAAAHLFNS